jgi:23S rRNA (uracil1939-C5)-methyltransferase
MADYIDDLLIESLAYGGSGIGHHDGKVVFVPLTAPGDRVRCRISRQKKRFVEAQVEHLLGPSDARISPACPVFGKCGGCQWQHLPYSEQCVWKERIFKDFLVRKLGVAPESVLPIVPSPQQWGYRSRVQFKCVNTSNGFQVGFYRRSSHHVIPVPNCPIVHPAINHAKDLICTWISNTKWAKRVPQIDLAVDDQDRVRAVIHSLASNVDDFVDHLCQQAAGSGLAVFVQPDRKVAPLHVCGPLELIVEVDTPVLRLGYGPGGFAQINLPQNRAMIREVVGALISDPPSRVLDLFCGMGNFSLPVARLAQELIGVEAYPQSIEMARLNARLNEVVNVDFIAREAFGAATLYGSDLPLDLVMLDPPRSGAYDVVRELVTVRPAKIVYVSCDPPTLVRDLQILLTSGYRLIWSRPFDLFPQTHHTESITLLERG